MLYYQLDQGRTGMCSKGRVAPAVPFFLVVLPFPTTANTFKPECSLPPPGTNFVSGPNTRGTLGILWNCLSIIILCTWSIQHLNVPRYRGEPRSLSQSLWWAFLDSLTKLKWMVVTVFVPEYLVGRALSELLVARQFRSHGLFSLVQTYMANMGYFVLDMGDYLEDSPPPPPEQSPTLTKSELINYDRLRHRYWALNASQLSRAAAFEMIDRASIPSTGLDKLDKGGALVKMLALVQVAYLIVQLAVRKTVGLPSSQLEVAALTFAVSSGITYALFWSRPQGVETRYILKPKPRSETSDKHQTEIPGQNREPTLEKKPWSDTTLPLYHFRKSLTFVDPFYLWHWRRDRAVQRPGRSSDVGPVPIPNDCSHIAMGAFSYFDFFNGVEESGILAVGAIVGGVVFGGIHCLAWNFDFPTAVERTLWRVCSAVTTGLPLLVVFPTTHWIRLQNSGTTGSGITGPLILIGFVLPYILCRLFILVEMFRTLFHLPPGAYVETWSGSFPHRG